MLQYEGKELTREELRREFAPVVDGKRLKPKELSRRIVAWSKYFLGDPELQADGHYHIKNDVPLFHKEIYEDLANDWKLYYISAPSEFAKTTTCTLVYPLYRILECGEPYVILSSRVVDTSIERLDELKRELTENPKIIEVYGEQKVGGRDYAWSDNVIEIKSGSVVRAIGWGGNVRARKKKSFRPTLFIGDDPEEVADIRSAAITRDHIDWLNRTVVPRMDKEYGKVRVVGTLIGLGGTLDTCMKDPRWRGRVYKALVPDDAPIEKRKSIWESRWPTAFLQQERLDYMRAGKINDWMFERMNEPVASLVKNLKGYRFHDSYFERKNNQNLLWVEGYRDPISIFTYHAIDPAFSQAESADERAQVTFGMGYLPLRDGKQQASIFVLEYDFDHKDPDEVVNRAIDLHRKYYYRELIIETVAGQKIYEYIATKAMLGDPFLINNPLNTSFIDYQARSKEDRIYTYFRTICALGQLYIRPQMPEMQSELDLFLQCSHLHLLDALEMGCRYAIPCGEDIEVMSPKLKKIVQRDDVLDDLKERGKDWLLW